MNKAQNLDIDFGQVATWIRLAEKKFLENKRQVLEMQIQHANLQLKYLDQQLQELAIKEALAESRKEAAATSKAKMDQVITHLLSLDMLSPDQIAEAFNIEEQYVKGIHKTILRKLYPRSAKIA